LSVNLLLDLKITKLSSLVFWKKLQLNIASLHLKQEKYLPLDTKKT